MSERLEMIIHRRQWFALLLGVVCLLLCFAGWFISPRQFFVSYLFAELVWVGVSLGCMAFLMIHYLTGGKWGWPIRRMFEAAAGSLPVLGLFFVPIFFGLSQLYPWARPAEVATNHVLQHRHPYLGAPSYVVKTIIVFLIWSGLAWRLNSLSRAQDLTQDVEPMRRLRKWSGPGLVIYPLMVTVAFVDWVMSLEADWFSTMFPVLVCIGQMLSGLAFVILLLSWIGPRSALSETIGKQTFRHLGSLLLAFTMLWAYLAFAQLLVIWSGDLPHEISWYLHRIAGGWRWVVGFLVIFHFFGPFFLLLSRQVKQTRRALAAVAALMFVAHVIDVWWLVTPSFYTSGIHISWLDFTALFGIGGIWLFVFFYRLKRKPLLPINDPRFAVATLV
jgi:hypothetical protein